MFPIIINSVVRSVIAFILLLIITRLIGRKAISQMTFFDLVVIFTLGAITATFTVTRDNTTVSSVTGLITFGLLAILTGYLHIKSHWIRKLVNSEPVTAIENGKIVDKNLKKVRFTINELTALLREKNIFNFADVEFAIIERDGQLSVLPKSQKSPLTPSDMNIQTGYKGLTKDLVMDGNILVENLKAAQIDENWLTTQLYNQGIFDVKQVFYAGLDSSGNLYVSKRQQNTEEKPGQYGIE